MCHGSFLQLSFPFLSIFSLFTVPRLNLDCFGHVSFFKISLSLTLFLFVSRSAARLKQLEFDHVNTIRCGDLKRRVSSRQQSQSHTGRAGPDLHDLVICVCVY